MGSGAFYVIWPYPKNSCAKLAPILNLHKNWKGGAKLERWCKIGKVVQNWKGGASQKKRKVVQVKKKER